MFVMSSADMSHWFWYRHIGVILEMSLLFLLLFTCLLPLPRRLCFHMCIVCLSLCLSVYRIT